jgi:hypothetical protein
MITWNVYRNGRFVAQVMATSEADAIRTAIGVEDSSYFITNAAIPAGNPWAHPVASVALH